MRPPLVRRLAFGGMVRLGSMSRAVTVPVLAAGGGGGGEAKDMAVGVVLGGDVTG